MESLQGGLSTEPGQGYQPSTAPLPLKSCEILLMNECCNPASLHENTSTADLRPAPNHSRGLQSTVQTMGRGFANEA